MPFGPPPGQVRPPLRRQGPAALVLASLASLAAAGLSGCERRATQHCSLSFCLSETYPILHTDDFGDTSIHMTSVKARNDSLHHGILIQETSGSHWALGMGPIVSDPFDRPLELALGRNAGLTLEPASEGGSAVIQFEVEGSPKPRVRISGACDDVRNDCPALDVARAMRPVGALDKALSWRLKPFWRNWGPPAVIE